jgi:methyl-accepting chemotaxis protein
MPNLDELEHKVDQLDSLTSSIFRFNDAFHGIEQASQDTSDNDVGRLRGILDTFRGKLPDLLTYSRLEADAKDLADNLMLATLADRIARINARNEALAGLTGELKTQIDKANSDANLLKQIKDGVDKATKTVTAAKTLVDQLTATDASTKDRLKALIDALGNISSIFKPAGP